MLLISSDLLNSIRLIFRLRTNRTSQLCLFHFYKALKLISISLALTSCDSSEKTKTANRKPEVQIESLKSHMAMRQYFSQLVKNDEITNPYYGDSLVRKYEAALLLAQKDENKPAIASLTARLGLALVDYGEIQEGIRKLNIAYKIYDSPLFPKNTLGELAYALGVAHMRLGETENCCANHVPESCIIPFSETAIHSVR